MSKRHQLNRRRSYGRRQHEVREREERGPLTGDVPAVLEAVGRHIDARRTSLHDHAPAGGAIRASF